MSALHAKRTVIALCVTGLCVGALFPLFFAQTTMLGPVQADGPLIPRLREGASLAELRGIIAVRPDCVEREGVVAGPPIVYAVALQRDDVVEMLLAAGANVNQVSRIGGFEGEAALHVAVRLDDAKMVALLLNNGADPFLETAKCPSPYELAKARGSPAIRQLLLLE